MSNPAQGAVGAARVCHKEQMTIWSGEIVSRLNMGGYFRDDLSYDDIVDINAAVSEEIRSIAGTAFALATPRTDSDERTAGASAVAQALRTADWGGVSIGNKALIAAAINELEATPAPATPPGVPDSLREAFAAATDSPVFVHDFADPAVSSAPGCQDVSLSFVTPDHITAAFMGNGLAGTIDQARKDAVALAAAWNHVRALIAAQPAGQSEPPILRVVVEVYPDRTDTRLTFGDRIRPEPGVKAVEQAISALQAEFDGRNGCPAIKSSKRSPQETWISVSALQPQQKAMLGRWSQGAPNEDGSPYFYWQQCSGRYFDFQGERHWCLDGRRFEGAPFYGESPTHALIIAEPPPHGSWGNQVGQSEDDVERCIACDKPLKAGELVLPDAEGGTIHTACCGPERESYTGADGGPLAPNDPIPQGYVYEGEQPTGQSAGPDSLRALSEAARQGEWKLEELKNHGTSVSDQFVSYGIDCGGHTILDTLNSGGGFLEQEPADDDIGPFVWDEQARRDLTFIVELVSAYRSGALIAARPAGQSTGQGAETREHHLEEQLREGLAFIEMEAEAQEPGSDLYTWVKVTEQLLSGKPAPDSTRTGQGEDWRDDPSADVRWNAGLVYGHDQLCRVLGVDPDKVSWDAATETLDGDVQSVICNILRAWAGDDWQALAARPAAPEAQGAWRVGCEQLYLDASAAIEGVAQELEAIDRTASAKMLRNALDTLLGVEPNATLPAADDATKRIVAHAWERFQRGVSGHADKDGGHERRACENCGGQKHTDMGTTVCSVCAGTGVETAVDSTIEAGTARGLDRAPPSAQEAWRSQAANDVLAERRRQIEAEGWTAEHDDTHSRGELASAAACYATELDLWTGYEQADRKGRATLISAERVWPWSGWWKPTDRRRNLVKAGALILAEIERLDRLPAPPSSGQGGR